MSSEFNPRPAEYANSEFAPEAEPVVFGQLEDDLTTITPEDDPDDMPPVPPSISIESPAGSAGGESGADEDPEPVRQRLVVKEEQGVITFTLEPDDNPLAPETVGLTRKWLQAISVPEVATPTEPPVAEAAQASAEAPEASSQSVSEADPVPQTVTVEDRPTEPSPGAPEVAAVEQQPPTIYMEEEQNDGSVHRIEASPEDVEEILDNMAQLRKIVRETVPGYQEYLSTEMDDFFEAKGLPSNPVYLLSPAEIATLCTNLREAGYSNWRLEAVGTNPDGSGDQGVFVPALGLAIVANTRANTHDIMHLEYLVAHEKMHAANGHHTIIAKATLRGTKMYDYERIGHAEIATGRGFFVEEGDANSGAAEYIKQAFNRPYGAWDEPEPILIPENPPLYLPPAYVWPIATGAPGISTDLGAFAAVALDLIKREVPSLSAGLVEGRSTQQGLNAVESAFNQVLPGLYDDVANLPGTTAGMHTGLRKVQRALGRAAWDVV